MEKKDAVSVVASKAAGEEEEYVRPENPYDTSIIDSKAAGEEEEYIRPKNPYDTSIIDKQPEVLTSDIDSDDGSLHMKTRHVLRRLQSSQYDAYFAGDIYRFPFCNRRPSTTDFNCLVTHAESLNSSRPNVGESMNINTFIAHHNALGIHLRNLQQVAIAEGRMTPIKPKIPKIKGLGSKKWRKRQREEAEARRWG